MHQHSDADCHDYPRKDLLPHEFSSGLPIRAGFALAGSLHLHRTERRAVDFAFTIFKPGFLRYDTTIRIAHYAT
jgi:hypothetical protein